MTQTVTGAPFWTAGAKLNQYPYLMQHEECEVAVVGGGITGALCAYALQKAGVDTILLDAGLVGFGSTGASSSMLQYDIDYDLTSLKDLLGIEKAVRAFRACSRGVDEIERITKELGENVGFARRDSFYYTPCESGVETMKREFLLRRHHEFPVEFMDNVTAAEKFSFRAEAGIYTVGMSGEIDPCRFTQALIADAVEMGMRVYENTSVELVTPDDSGITLDTATRQSVRAKKMVNATGLPAAKEAGRAIQQRTTFCIVTAPVNEFNGWYNRCLIRDSGDPYIYLRTLPDNRILIGGLDCRYLDAAGSIGGVIKIPAAVQRRYNELEQRLISMMTGIDGIQAEYRFAGMYGDTGDGLPYIGTKPGYPNVYFDICGGSNGLVFAQLGADIVRDLYLGGDAADADLFCFGRL